MQVHSWLEGPKVHKLCTGFTYTAMSSGPTAGPYCGRCGSNTQRRTCIVWCI